MSDPPSSNPPVEGLREAREYWCSNHNQPLAACGCGGYLHPRPKRQSAMTTNTDAFKEAMEAIEDYGKWEELCSLAEADDREKHGGMDACKTKKRAARSRLGSIYREQQQEIERLREQLELADTLFRNTDREAQSVIWSGVADKYSALRRNPTRTSPESDTK